MIVAFSFLAPVPFIPLEPSFSGSIGCLSLYGMALSMQVSASFPGAQSEAVRAGYPDDMFTFGLVSGLWTASFSIGAFVGPTAAGYLQEAYGFRYATLFIVALNMCLLVASLCHISIGYVKRNRSVTQGLLQE